MTRDQRQPEQDLVFDQIPQKQSIFAYRNHFFVCVLDSETRIRQRQTLVQVYCVPKRPEASFATQINRSLAIQNRKGAPGLVALECQRSIDLAKLVRKRLA